MYIVQTDSGSAHISEYDGSGHLHLGAGAQQFATLAEVEAAFQGQDLFLNGEEYEPTPLAQPFKASAILGRLGVSKADLHAVLHYAQTDEWSPAGHYRKGDKVAYADRVWVALSDVKDGTPPDDVYAADGSTGGWLPA